MIAQVEERQPGVMEIVAGGIGMPPSRALSVLEQRQQKAARMLESLTDVLDNYVDPEEAYLDEKGVKWDALGGDGRKTAINLNTEADLKTARNNCRELAGTNGYAINGHENRISYIVGSGHAYTVTARKGQEVDEAQLDEGQRVVDDFIRENKWHQRQQEIMRRKDRDGECFLRFFSGDGMLRVRFVEPGQICQPTDKVEDPDASFGIQTAPKDVETVLGYWVDGEFVEGHEIQHRKLGVDSNVKRGIPLFHPVRRKLIRAEKIERNMAVIGEVTAAIALIRKHNTATKTGIQSFVQDNADVSVTSQSTGETSYHRHYGPGSVLDANANVDYDFPSARVNPAVYVPVLQAILRGVASRLVMPEFMLTSDASNANYSSTMVAEGPAVKMFQRLQWDMITNDLEVMEQALDVAVAAGRLDEGLRQAIEVQVTPPRLETRDRLKETQGDVLLVDRDIMSKAEGARRADLDPEKMEEEIAAEKDKARERDPMYGLRYGGEEEEDEEPEEVPAVED